MKNTSSIPSRTRKVDEAPYPGRSATLLERPLSLVRLSGKDPVGMLNAILTNDVPKENNLGVYAMLLNPKGRIQTDLRVLKHGDGVIVVTEPAGADAAKEILGRYAPFSRVKLEELPEWYVLGLYGPEANGILGVELAEHATAEMNIGDTAVLAVGVAAPISGYDLILPADELRSVEGYLAEHGATPSSPESYETARIEAGIPRFGADITPDNFPGETGVLERAVSFGKGCYPGQETVARMRYRGHPNRILHRFAFENASITPGAEILQDGKAVGTVTSVAPLKSDVHGKVQALGYLSRKADSEAPLMVADVHLSHRGPVHS